jgi:tetratricopeptide (TPR) repeat protein
MDALRRILATEPADPSALPMVLDSLRRNGQFDEVIAVAQRALAVMPDNFFALDGLAWARMQRGEHQQAKQAIDQALASLRDLGLDRPFGRAAKLSIGAVRLVGHLPFLRKALPQVPEIREMQRSSAEWAEGWRTWANNYVQWYERERISGGDGAVEQADAADEAQGGTRTAS